MHWSNTMQVFDASSMIYAWDNYPINLFPKLWEWIGIQISTQQIVVSEVAFDEIVHKTPDCSNWMKTCSIKKIPVTSDIMIKASEI